MKFNKLLILGFLLIALVALPVSFAADISVTDLNPNDVGGTDLSLKEVNQSISSEITSDLIGGNDGSINVVGISNDDTIYINASYSGSDENGTLEKPYKNINTGVTALLNSSKHNLFIANGNYMIDSSMNINKDINVIGQSTSEVIVNCQGNCFFNCTNNNFCIYNLTIYNGCSNGSDTIICGDSANIYLYNIIFNKTQASNGGGVLLNKNGILSLSNCSIINTNITYLNTGILGGIIYTEGSEVSVINCSFINTNITSLNSKGGFIYVKNGNFEFINSTISNFSDYSPYIEGAFIAYVSSRAYVAHIFNSVFEKSNFTDVLGLIESYGHLILNNTNISNNYVKHLNGNVSIIDHYSISSIENLNLFNNTFEDVSTNLSDIFNFLYVNGYFNISDQLPDKYDLREYNLTTEVKDQNPHETCWAFASIAALESYLLKNWNESFDLSENNMKNIMGKNGINGSEWDTDNGGNDVLALAYLLRWSGAVNESDDPYYSPSSILYDAVCHVQDVIYIPLRLNYTDNDQIKYAIMKYGAVWTEMHATGILQEQQPNIYSSECRNSDHAVAIVGWDDNYSADNFENHPPGNGAFIVKNSWGTGFGYDGYFYVSYYDASFAGFASNSKFSGFVFSNVEKVDNYDSIYYYDPFGNDFVAAGYLSNTGWFANQFVSNDKEILSAFGIYTYGDSNYTANIYINNKLVHTQEGAIYNAGYHTIKLNQQLGLNKGDIFKIEIKLTTPNLYPIAIEKYIEGFVNATANPNESFVSADGVNWDDLTDLIENANVCIKAYTKDLNDSKVYLESFNASALGSVNLIAKVYYNNSICEGNVTFYIGDDKIATVKLVDGIATYKYTCGVAGIFTVKAVYNGNDIYKSSKNTSELVVNKIPVSMTITQNNTYYKSAFITITLNKAISGQKITLKFSNGKTATVSTNSKRVATYYVPFAVGSYTVTGSASNSYYDIKTVDSYKISIKKVTATITAYKLTTTYKSGKYFQVKVTNPKGQVMVGVKLKLKVYTGKKYKTVSITTGTNGIAKYSGSSLSIAKHKIIVSSAESTKYMTASSKTNYLTVKKGTTTVTAPVVKNKYKKSQYFKVTIKNKASGKLISGLYLKIKVYTGKKYKTYKVKTNSKGIAYLNTKALSKGSHKVVISTTSKYYSVSKSGYLIKIVK